MATDFGSIWRSYRSDLIERNERFLAELTAAWKDQEAILETQKASFPQPEAWNWEPGSISSLRQLFEDTASRVLLEHMDACRKAKPQQRALAAIEKLEAGYEDILRRLPATVEVSGRDLAVVLRPEARGRLRAMIRYWQQRPRAVPLRRIAADHLLRQRQQWAPSVGACLATLAQASLAVVDPWEALSAEALERVQGGSPKADGLRQAQDRWLKVIGGHRRKARQALESLSRLVTASPATLAASLLRAQRPPRARGEHRSAKLLEYSSYWARQRRAVTALMELDVKLVSLGARAVRRAESTKQSLEAEHEDLLRELDAVASWLQSRRDDNQEAFPPPQARLVSAYDRTRDWLAGVAREATGLLPSTIETMNPGRALPGWRAPWREVHPGELFVGELADSGRQLALRGLEEAAAGHRATVREIERAREVVTYSLEVARTEGESGKEVAREGIENALSLILYQQETAGPVSPMAEAGLAEGTAVVFANCYVAVDQGRLGMLAHFARQGGYRSVRGVLQVSAAYWRRFLVWLWGRLRGFYRWSMIQIGWERAPEPRLRHVQERGYLGDSLSLDRDPRDLPMIYERLFRLQPVEDPRFLVGRDAEMTALADARAEWEAGRAVSVVIAGQRGSGKTSLLNCALVRVFHDAEVVQGRFADRLETATRMEEFLRETLRIPADADLRTALKQQRRVVVLEEGERTFLRHVNGFEGLRALLSLISDTSRGTLWILSLNLLAFKFLDASAALGQHFSHRINAMSVEPENLKNAVILRHNLSGLRLHFAAPPGNTRLLERAKGWVGLHEDRQEVFFDALYRQSEGVFRTAFDLWRRYIDRAEAGVLYMRHPLAPDYDALVGNLGCEDLFTLQAVMQHGSLTACEHARVFGVPENQSRNRLTGLADREILEPDPQAPGWRVRPDAGFLVRKALDAENLL